jgi:formate dehydrogenase major subunit
MALGMAGFPDYCSPGDACIASSATALSLCLGSGVTPSTLNEVLNAETLVLFGANIAEMYPPYMRWIDLAREKGVKIIFLDPRETPTSNFCDEQLMPRPGTDGALVLGVIRYLFENNLYDKDFVASHVNGAEELFNASEPYTPDKVSAITWIPEEKVVSFARTLGNSKRTMIWMGGSLSRNTNAIQTVRTIIALQAITNNLTGMGKGLMNVQGGKPGGEDEFMEHYISPDLEPGMRFRKVQFSMEHESLDILLLNSSYRRYPDANKVKEAISKVGFVVHRGFFMNEEAMLSDLIIPGTMTYESEGSQYGAQRQVVWRNKVVERPGETVEDWRFYIDLGKRINPGTFPDINSAEEIYELFRQKIDSWKGITLARLKASSTGITWPCYSEDEDKRDTLYPDNKFLTPDGKVNLKNSALGAITWEEPKGSPAGDSAGDEDRAYPLIFTQGKVVQHWQHTYTNWSSYMDGFSEGAYVQVHPETIQALDIKDGEWVYLETSIGRLKARAKITTSILPGIIFTPSHPSPASPFSGNNGTTVNSIIPGYWDKVSAQFNGFGCRLTKALEE